MTRDILITTQFALSQLQKTGNIKIHSVYRKTVNLRCDGRLLSLHPKDTPLSPVGMLTDMDETEFSSLGCSVEERVNFRGNAFSIRDISFSFKHVKSEGTGLIPISRGRERALCRMISHALRVSPQNTVFCDLLLGGEEYLSSPPAVYAQKILDSTKECLGRGDVSSAADSLTKLIGLGAGLTPSGDDFLCGILAALSMGGSCSELLPVLKIKILEKLPLTNDISGEFLRCACEGHFSRSIRELPNAESTDEVVRSFSKIGHSSGADTLNGILFLFSQGSEKEPIV